MTDPRPAAVRLAEALGCKVTLIRNRRHRNERCGLPVVANGLCAKHEAERIRLGGDP